MVYAALRIYIPKKQWLPDIQFSKNYRMDYLNHLVAVRLRPFGLRRDSSMRKSSSFELDFRIELVENTGIEPVTSCVQGRRSPS